jgi:tetratricopeptide (TPR) repeat protein
MKIRVAYNHDLALIERVVEYREYVDSIYFSPNINIFPSSGAFVSPTIRWDKYDDELKRSIRYLKEKGINAYLLLNATNFDPEMLKNYERSELRKYLKAMVNEGLEHAVIFNLPLGRKIKKDIPELKLDVSITAGIDNIEKAKYWVDQLEVEGICVHQRLNKKPDVVKEIKRKTGAKISIIVNNMCLSNCPNEISHNNFCTYRDVPKTYFNCCAMIAEKPWYAFHQGHVVPANLKYFKGALDIVKVEGRSDSTENLIKQIYHYIFRLDSYEYTYGIAVSNFPSYHPYSLNKEPPEVFERVGKCENNCDDCGYCYRLWKKYYGFDDSVDYYVEGYKLNNRCDYTGSALMFEKYLAGSSETREGEVYFYLGLDYEGTRQYDKAVANFDKAAASEYGRMRYDIYWHIGICRYQLGQFSDALSNYMTALQLAPPTEVCDMYLGIGMTFLMLREYDKAVEYFEKYRDCDKQDKDLGEMYFNLGVCYKELEKYPRALECYESAGKNGSNKDSPWHSSLLFHQGLCCIAMKEYGNAKEKLEAAVIGGENKSKVYFNLGVSRQGLGEYRKAIEAYKEAYKQSKESESSEQGLMLYQEGLCLIALKEYDGAEGTLNAAKAKGGASVEVELNLGICAHEKKDYAGARAAFERALSILSASPGGQELERSVRFNKGISAIESGDAATGIRELEQAKVLGGLGREVRFNLGLGYENAGRYKEAKEEYEAAIQGREVAADHETGTLYLHKGICQMELGDASGAKGAISEAIKQNPEALENYNMLGSICRTLREPEQGIAAISEGLRRGRGSSVTRSMSYRLLGVLKRDLGKMAEAEENLKKAISEDANEWSNYNILGNIYRMSGKNPEADDMFTKAINLAPEDYKSKIREKMKDNGGK